MTDAKKSPVSITAVISDDTWHIGDLLKQFSQIGVHESGWLIDIDPSRQRQGAPKVAFDVEQVNDNLYRGKEIETDEHGAIVIQMVKLGDGKQKFMTKKVPNGLTVYIKKPRQRALTA